MEKNQKQIMKVLKDMGYTPEIDEDGDICLYLELKHFYFFVTETEDTKYVNLLLPQFAPIEEGEEVLALARTPKDINLYDGRRFSLIPLPAEKAESPCWVLST